SPPHARFRRVRKDLRGAAGHRQSHRDDADVPRPDPQAHGRRQETDRARGEHRGGIVLTLSALVGEHLLGFFGITIASFRVGGAILILLLAISMMHAAPSGERQTPEEAKEAEDKESIAVVPLAIPLLSGPGAISTTIIYAAQRP